MGDWGLGEEGMGLRGRGAEAGRWQVARKKSSPMRNPCPQPACNRIRRETTPHSPRTLGQYCATSSLQTDVSGESDE